MKVIALLAALLAPSSLISANAVGVPTAPIQVEVFSDFQCSHCRQLHEQTLQPLINDYVRTGKVYLINREFPLTGGPYSLPAARYACAAARVGKYAQVADALFAGQLAWGASGKVEEAALGVLTPAEAAKVRALVQDPSISAEVERDVELASKFKIRQTPTLILTHKLKQYPLTGSVSYALLRRFLDELLSK